MTPQIVTIQDASSGSSAQVLVSLGFNCFRWQPVCADGARDVLWCEPGFEAGDKRPSASGIPLMFPFPGRIGGARFQFAGRDYELEPGDGMGNAIHGFVLNRPWKVVAQQADRVEGEFQASVVDRSILERWPADFRIRVSYQVRGRELISAIRYENVGSGPLPCGFGTHAYFRLPLILQGDAEQTHVRVPAAETWEAEAMLPTGRKLPATGPLNLADGNPLAGRKFDTYFTSLRPEADSTVRTVLEDAGGHAIVQTFDRTFTQCIVYTPPHREAICIEPYTCLPDSFRLTAAGHNTGLQILQPGEQFATTIRLEAR